MHRLSPSTRVIAAGALAQHAGDPSPEQPLQDLLADYRFRRSDSWALEIATLIEQMGEPTIQELADAWQAVRPDYPGISGAYHTPDETGRTLRTPEESYRFGVYRSVRTLRERGLVVTRDDDGEQAVAHPDYRLLSVQPLDATGVRCNHGWKHSGSYRAAVWKVRVLSPNKPWTWTVCDGCRDRLLRLYEWASRDLSGG
jgi:hypothetical protein